MPGPSPFVIPDAFDHVWAFSDVHAVRSGLFAALVAAGIADADGHWVAPAGTALVGCGDYIDRGTDPAGLIDLLSRLAGEAANAGGLVVLARGNHEQMALDALAGSPEWLRSWLANGGGATLTGLGVAPSGALSPLLIEASLADKAPGVRSWLEAMPECVRWRDVLFIHAGPPPGRELEMYGRRSYDDGPNGWLEHLWVRSEFYAGRGIAGPDFAHLQAAGIRRVVFGHTPMDAPTLFHHGMSLCIDTNACASGADPAFLTLARIPGAGSLDATTFVRIPTTDAPDKRAWLRTPLREARRAGHALTGRGARARITAR